MREEITIMIICLATFVSSCGSPQPSGKCISFSADQIITTDQGRTRKTARCYWTPTRVRIETKLHGVPGESIVIIGRKDLGIGWILLPGLRRYRGIPLGDVHPCTLFYSFSPKDVMETIKTEIVEGFPCRELRIRRMLDGGEKTGEEMVWMAENFPIPLRYRSAEGRTVEYRNIDESPQPVELFELPEGYRKMTTFPPFGGL